MKNTDVAKKMIEQALRRLTTARREARRGSSSYAVRSTQEREELSLKAALMFVGIDYPKRHDVSLALIAARGRFPTWFDLEKKLEMARWLNARREAAMYGNETGRKGSNELFDRGEAKRGVRYAEEIYFACKRLVYIKER